MLTSLVLAAAVAFSSPEAVVEQFCARYVKLNDAYGLLETKESQETLAPMLSKRLLHKVEELRACQTDWGRQQPKDSTDKPPYVDCCIFSSIPDRMPTSYTHTFQIEEFRRPEFEESAQASPGPFIIGGGGDVTVDAK